MRPSVVGAARSTSLGSRPRRSCRRAAAACAACARPPPSAPPRAWHGSPLRRRRRPRRGSSGQGCRWSRASSRLGAGRSSNSGGGGGLRSRLAGGTSPGAVTWAWARGEWRTRSETWCCLCRRSSRGGWPALPRPWTTRRRGTSACCLTSRRARAPCWADAGVQGWRAHGAAGGDVHAQRRRPPAARVQELDGP